MLPLAMYTFLYIVLLAHKTTAKTWSNTAACESCSVYIGLKKLLARIRKQKTKQNDPALRCE